MTRKNASWPWASWRASRWPTRYKDYTCDDIGDWWLEMVFHFQERVDVVGVDVFEYFQQLQLSSSVLRPTVKVWNFRGLACVGQFPVRCERTTAETFVLTYSFTWSVPLFLASLCTAEMPRLLLPQGQQREVLRTRIWKRVSNSLYMLRLRHGTLRHEWRNV